MRVRIIVRAVFASALLLFFWFIFVCIFLSFPLRWEKSGPSGGGYEVDAPR